MGANKSKLLDDIKSNIHHSLTEISLDDLIDGTVIKKEFKSTIFKEYMREDLLNEDEEESNLLRHVEIFKRDMFLNFTNSAIGKEIPNMSTNHVYDKFNFEYNNSYHNEFQSRVVQITNFLLSIFLNLAKTEVQKDEVVNLLVNLQKELANDQTAQQKFFGVFSIVNNLSKMINTEKNYVDFFRILETYSSFLEGFLKDSPFTIYLIKDHVIELTDSIVTNIIENEALDESLRKQGLAALLKIGICFKIFDVYLQFVENLLKYECGDIKKELNSFLKEIFDYKFDIEYSKIENENTSFNPNYTEKILFTDNSTYAIDGTYIYLNKSDGLYKIGTGFNNTIRGKIYAKNSQITYENKVSLVTCCGKLYMRSVNVKPLPFMIFNTEDLSISMDIPQSFSEDRSVTHFFEDCETSPTNLSYAIEGHELIKSDRSDTPSKLVSDGRFLFIVSKVGELNCKDKNFKGLYPNNILINIDVYDPLNNFTFITSFPIKDENKVLGDNSSAFTSECLASSIVTDGRVLHFFTKHQVTFNMITRNISHVNVNEATQPISNLILDNKNSLIWSFVSESDEAKTLKCIYRDSGINQFPVYPKGNYSIYTSHKPFLLIDQINCLFTKNNKSTVLKEKEENIYDFFFKEKSKTKPSEISESSKIDTHQLVSIILNSLADRARFTLNQNQVNKKDILSHIFSAHVLHLNARAMNSLNKIINHFDNAVQIENNFELETKLQIKSALYKLMNSHMNQIKLLKFNKFKDFETDFEYLKGLVEKSILILEEFQFSNKESSNQLSTDIVFQAMEIIENYGEMFSINYPHFEAFITIATSSNARLLDYKKFAINCISKSGNKSFTSENIKYLKEVLETLMTRNDKIILSIIDLMLESSEPSSIAYSTEYEKEDENFFLPLLKSLFNSYIAISNSKDDREKQIESENFNSLFDLFQNLLTSFFTHFSNLVSHIDEKFKNKKFDDLKSYTTIVESLSNLMKSSSYTFRFLFSSATLMNILSRENKVIFTTWHYFYDNMILIDKSNSFHKNIYSSLTVSNIGNIESEPFNFVLETAHPTKKIDLNKKFTFENNLKFINLEFDPLSFKHAESELSLTVVTAEEEINENFNNGYENKTYEGVKSISVSYKTNDSQSYGLKLHIHNTPKEIYHFRELSTLNTCFILNSIKTFFFFSYSKSNSSNRDVEEMLQSKLFEGGINELLDLETSSKEYQSFVYSLKNSNSINEFQRRLSNDQEESEENHQTPFDIEEFVNQENISVEKLIMYFQKSLRPRYPWINIGGVNADKIVRAAFSIVVKQEKLYPMITKVVNDIIDAEEALEPDTSLTLKSLGDIENFEYLLLVWTEISRLRQWYQEQVKDLAEANIDDFDKQNENFVNNVVEKCKFLFTINAPKGKKANIKQKLNYLKIFARSQIISNANIDNDIVKANAIKFKKNLMQNKLDEGKTEIENVKKQIQSVTNCLKLTKVSIEALQNAMRELNTRAKFREISLSLINSLLLEVENQDTKLFIVKQIVQSLRRLTGKRLISIDDEIRSASPELLNIIQNKFHNLIQILFGSLIKSNSIFFISEYLDCLFWNLRARNQKVLIETNFFENLFVNSPNSIIKNVWNKITKLEMSFYKKNNNSLIFDQKSLGLQLLEFFHVYSSMIAGRVIDETHLEDGGNDQPTKFVKKLSSVFDNSFDKLIENISHVISMKLKEFIENYQKINVTVYLNEFLKAEESENKFTSTYFDESYLNLFLLLVYKFNINRSNLIMKHMKDPDFLVSLILILRYTSGKNVYCLANILKVYLTSLNDEDLNNLAYFLRKNELFISQKFSGFDPLDENINPKNLLILYFLNIIYELRKGLFTKSVTLSYEYEVSYYIIDLLKFLYTEEKWRGDFDNVAIQYFSEMNIKIDSTDFKLVSPILSVFNGDCEDMHYGSYIYLKYSSSNYSKSITDLYREKVEEIDSCSNGYILGFCSQDVQINEFKNNKEAKNFFDTSLHFSRQAEDNYAVIITINREMYDKSKLKNNDVEFQTRHVKDLILHPSILTKINNPQIINLLFSKENEILELLSDPTFSYSFNILYLQSQLIKSMNSIFSGTNELSSEANEYLTKNFSIERLKPLISNLTNTRYNGLKFSQYELIHQIKLFLNGKTSLKFEFSDSIEKKVEPIKCEFLRMSRSLRIYQNNLLNGNIFKIASSNCTIDSDTFLKINTLKVVTLGDSKLKNYLNTIIYCPNCDSETIQKINKIDDINFALIFVKKDLSEVKININHPYIVLNAENSQIEGLLHAIESKLPTDSNLIFKSLEQIDNEKFKVTSESINTARTKDTNEPSINEASGEIKFEEPNEFNIPEVVTLILSKMSEQPKSLTKEKLYNTLKSLNTSYIRFLLVHIVSINSNLITHENYKFLVEQFKIVFYDACKTSLINTFNYSKFSYINTMLIQLHSKENEYDTKIYTVDSKTKIFNSHSEVQEIDFSKNIQSELVEMILQNEADSLANCEKLKREKYLEMTLKLLNLVTLTINYETKTFSQYLARTKENLIKYIDSVKAEDSIELLDAEFTKFKSEGIDKLIKYLINSIEKENKKYSSRTKIMLCFAWEFCKLITEAYKRIYGEERSYLYEDLPNYSFLSNLLDNINIIYYKSKHKGTRNKSLFGLSDVKKKLTKEIEIPICPYTIEIRFDHSDTLTHMLTPNNQTSLAKILLVAQKNSNDNYNLKEFANDEDNNKIVNKNASDNLFIVNKNNLTHDLWMCGYNEKWRLGNESLSDYQYVYVPIQSNIEKNIRIKKLMHGYPSTLVATYDNKIYACGEGTVSGLSENSKTYSLNNKWNNVLKKEKFIDFCLNENSAGVMVTDKNVWALGCNSYNCLGDMVNQGNNTPDIVKVTIPFRASKVVEVSLGYTHCLYRLDDGSVYGNGCNYCYELNLDNTSNYIATVTKLPLNNLKCEKVSAGYHASIFLMREKEKLRLYSCGSYDYGQNGQGSSNTKRFNKCRGTENLEFKYAKIGYYCCLAITNTDKLYTWGYYGNYNLGYSESNYQYEPKNVEFFNDMQVIDADINERNLVVSCKDSSGSSKLYTAGYNGYGCMGISDQLETYNKIPLEVTTFNGKHVQKAYLTGCAYSISFVTSNLLINNDFDKTLYLLPKTENNKKVCLTTKDLVGDSNFNNLNVVIAIRGIELNATILAQIELPDLSEINNQIEGMVNDKHDLICHETKNPIDEGMAFIVADELANDNIVAFSEAGYKSTFYFEVPRFVYCVKYAIDYKKCLPALNSYSLLKFEANDKIKFNDFHKLNDSGLKKFFSENSDTIQNINHQFDEIKIEHFNEFIKITDGATLEKKVLMEEIKKVPILAKLSQSQLETIEKISTNLDSTMKNIKDFIDMNFNNTIKEIYISNLQYLGKKTRNELFDNSLYDGANDVSHDSYPLNLSRGKVIKFKQKNNVDYQGNYTFFGQVFKGIKSIPTSQFLCRKNNRLFKVYLVGEGAIDAGGPYREIMNILCDELQSQWLDLLIPSPNNKFSAGQDREKWTINPAAKSNTHLEMYKVLGKLFGFAIRSTGYMNLNLPSFVWKQLLDQPIEICDIERIDVHTANFIEDLMDLESKGIDEEQFEYIYDQQFTTILSNGKEIEVESGGRNKKLTFSNAKEYAKLALNARFRECEVQIQAIKSGLYEVIKKELTILLSWKDLEERICGNLIVDANWLKENTIYDSWNENDQVVQFFWKAFNKFSNEEKILYLKFVWGRSRLPLTQDSFTQKHKIARSYNNHPDISLPLSHTCFFTVDIPPYSSYDILYNKLLYAIRFCGEIDNDNSPSQALEDL